MTDTIFLCGPIVFTKLWCGITVYSISIPTLRDTDTCLRCKFPPGHRLPVLRIGRSHLDKPNRVSPDPYVALDIHELYEPSVCVVQMLEKMEKEGRLEQEQEAMLYLLVVELRQDWRAARDLLAGPLGQILENSPSCYLRCISKVTMFLKSPMHSFMI
jgi:hypothetical protein